jgi:ankyrin repeat protein
MTYKTILVIISLILLLTGCNSRQINSNRNSNQVPAGKESVPEIQDYSLHQAALNGNKKEVLRLLEKGAGIDMKDPDGRTALMYSSYNGHTEIARECLNRGAKVNMRDNYGRTSLMFAASGPFPETVKLLLDNQADPNMADGEEHYTALMYAAAEGQLEVVKILLADKADPTLKDVDGDNAATFALNNGHKEVVDLIRSFINGQNNPGN